MTADEYDSGESTSPTARSGAVGGGSGTTSTATPPGADRTRVGLAGGAGRRPRTAAKTPRSTDTEGPLYG